MRAFILAALLGAIAIATYALDADRDLAGDSPAARASAKGAAVAELPGRTIGTTNINALGGILSAVSGSIPVNGISCVNTTGEPQNIVVAATAATSSTMTAGPAGRLPGGIVDCWSDAVGVRVSRF